MHQLATTSKLIVQLLALAVLVNSVAAVITVQIGGATRLNSLTRQRDRYRCYWDCDLVGCKIDHDDDECSYDCDKICHVRYDYAAGRSGASGDASAAASSTSGGLEGKSAVPSGSEQVNEVTPESLGAGTSVRLHLPRNASARNFAIWERCAPDASTGKLTEKPFNL